ncbi:MAG: hypothetical protein WC011_03985 [Candidatus Paceibacterota bacterium]
MKKLFFFVVIYVVSFSVSNSAFGQIDKMEKKIIPYDFQIGDWDIAIPLPAGKSLDENYEIYLCVNGDWCLPAKLTDKGIELIHPSELFLRENEEYYFKAVFVDSTGQVQQTEPLTLLAPDLEISLSWKVKNSDLKTEVSVSNTEGFVTNLEESYFSTIDDDTDSIIHGEYKKFPVTLKNDKFFGETHLQEESIATEKQYLIFSLRLDNDDGQVKLYGNELSALLVKGDFKLTRNLIGQGSFTPFFGDNIPKKGYIVSMSGQVVRELTLQSDEAIWLEDLPSGQYGLYIEGYPTKKIVKINFN